MSGLVVIDERTTPRAIASMKTSEVWKIIQHTVQNHTKAEFFSLVEKMQLGTLPPQIFLYDDCVCIPSGEMLII